ncbi:hypothetical protein MRX96_013236 [Rhipicephalus microplus]
MLIHCLFITQFTVYLPAYVSGNATVHDPDVTQCVAWLSFPRRVIDVTDSARRGCPICLVDNSGGFLFTSSALILNPTLEKTNVTLDSPITDRLSSTSTWSAAIYSSPMNSFISQRGNSGVGTMLIGCLFIAQLKSSRFGVSEDFSPQVRSIRKKLWDASACHTDSGFFVELRFDHVFIDEVRYVWDSLSNHLV